MKEIECTRSSEKTKKRNIFSTIKKKILTEAAMLVLGSSLWLGMPQVAGAITPYFCNEKDTYGDYNKCDLDFSSSLPLDNTINYSYPGERYQIKTKTTIGTWAPPTRLKLGYRWEDYPYGTGDFGFEIGLEIIGYDTNEQNEAVPSHEWPYCNKEISDSLKITKGSDDSIKYLNLNFGGETLQFGCGLAYCHIIEDWKIKGPTILSEYTPLDVEGNGTTALLRYLAVKSVDSYLLRYLSVNFNYYNLHGNGKGDGLTISLREPSVPDWFEEKEDVSLVENIHELSIPIEFGKNLGFIKIMPHYSFAKREELRKNRTVDDLSIGNDQSEPYHLVANEPYHSVTSRTIYGIDLFIPLTNAGYDNKTKILLKFGFLSGKIENSKYYSQERIISGSTQDLANVVSVGLVLNGFGERTK